MTPYPRPFAGRRVVTDIANVAIGAGGEEQLHHLAVSAAGRQVQRCDVVAGGGIDVGTAIDEQSPYCSFAPNCRLVKRRSSDPRPVCNGTGGPAGVDERPVLLEEPKHRRDVAVRARPEDVRGIRPCPCAMRYRQTAL